MPSKTPSSTPVPYPPTPSYTMTGTGLAYAALPRRPLLRYAFGTVPVSISVPAPARATSCPYAPMCYAMPGTGLTAGAIRLRGYWRSNVAIRLRSCYDMPGTDVGTVLPGGRTRDWASVPVLSYISLIVSIGSRALSAYARATPCPVPTDATTPPLVLGARYLRGQGTIPAAMPLCLCYALSGTGWLCPYA
eukprot:2943869-Rhodomonas_salina.1